MKKFFSTIIALVSLVVVSSVFTSCDKDDTSSDEGMQKYGFTYTVSNDYFDLFDINVTVYQGVKTTDVQFTESTTIEKMKGNVQAKATTAHTYSVDADTQFSVEAKVTLKSNWKEIVANKENWDFHVVYSKVEKNHFDIDSHGFSQSRDKITEDYLNQMGTFLKKQIDFVPSNK